MQDRKPHILIVDDDLVTADEIYHLLNKNYTLEFVHNGEDAWELIGFDSEPFDLVIIDPVLPRIDGMELLRRIREINPWLPTFILTAHSTHERAKQACNLSVSGYIEKPFNVNEFCERVKTIIYHHEPIAIGINSHKIKHHHVGHLHPAVAKCLEEIHKKYNKTFTNDDLAFMCDVSKQYLCKLFKKNCGTTIKGYLTELRIDIAKRLLQNTTHNVYWIQESLGYRSRTHFFNTFKKSTGISPMAYRRMANN